MARFEIVSKFENDNLALPVRATKKSAGYDLQAARDTLIPPYAEIMKSLCAVEAYPRTLDQMAQLTKAMAAKPTLVTTGMKVQLADNEYLEITARSSLPLKHWLIVANAEGIIDADYYNNPDNEGEIFFQLINLSPVPILIRKGDYIGQGIIKTYGKTDNDCAQADRIGGLGSSH